MLAGFKLQNHRICVFFMKAEESSGGTRKGCLGSAQKVSLDAIKHGKLWTMLQGSHATAYSHCVCTLGLSLSREASPYQTDLQQAREVW